MKKITEQCFCDICGEEIVGSHNKGSMSYSVDHYDSYSGGGAFIKNEFKDICYNCCNSITEFVSSLKNGKRS